MPHSVRAAAITLEEQRLNNDPSRHWTMLSPQVPGELLTAQAQQAEAAGLAGVGAPEFYGNPLVPLSHCGAVTSRVKLLSAITLPLVHNPFTLAMSAMDIDRLSGGRFILGLGPSARFMVEGFHGIRGYDRPVARLREAIEVIRLLIAQSHTGELTGFEGEFYRHDWTKYQGNHYPPLRAVRQSLAMSSSMASSPRRTTSRAKSPLLSSGGRETLTSYPAAVSAARTAAVTAAGAPASSLKRSTSLVLRSTMPWATRAFAPARAKPCSLATSRAIVATAA